MDSDPHPGAEAHVHGGRVHVHASVDHLAGASGASARLAIRLDAALMGKLGIAADAVVRLATERGRSMLARLDPPLEADAGTGIVRLDRFVRQALTPQAGRGSAPSPRQRKSVKHRPTAAGTAALRRTS
jgi:hypothetical protein